MDTANKNDESSRNVDMRKFYSDYSTVFCFQEMSHKVYLLEEFVYSFCITKRITCESLFVVDLNEDLSNENHKSNSEDDDIPSCFINNPYIDVNHQNELAEAGDFSSRNRDQSKEFLKYVKLDSFKRTINSIEFIEEIFQKRILSMSRMITYAKLRNENAYDIDDARNFGMDYSLYEKAKAKENSHTHASFLLKINPEFAQWLGLARISNNKVIAAQLKLKNSSLEFKIAPWLMELIGITGIENNQKTEQIDIPFGEQLRSLVEMHELKLIAFGLSKDS